jgi:site-specific DNA-methyltransferase (adenine-specific)
MRELKYIDETIERNENHASRIGSAGHSVLSTVYLMDCIEGMRQFPDKFFDLAVVDPPYGIGFSDYERGSSGVKVKERYTKNGKKDWDKGIPTPEYFAELKRVSKEQIIWGGNYFDLPPTQCFIFWYKQNPVPNFADGELAWTSFKKPAVCIDYRYYGNLQGKSIVVDAKIHPTQKPVALYDWILKNYAKEGDLILDTHLGSQSSRIAANKAGLDFVGFEIDREYYDNGNKRFKDFVSQTVLF